MPRHERECMSDKLKTDEKCGESNFLLQTMDAEIWTNEWLRIVKENPSIPTDKGTMLGWFANAIMTGWDEAHRRIVEARQKDACKYCEGRGYIGYMVETEIGPEGDSEVCYSCAGSGSQSVADVIATWDTPEDGAQAERARIIAIIRTGVGCDVADHQKGLCECGSLVEAIENANKADLSAFVENA